MNLWGISHSKYKISFFGKQERSRRGKAYIGQKSMHGRHGTGKDSHSSILGSSLDLGLDVVGSWATALPIKTFEGALVFDTSINPA